MAKGLGQIKSAESYRRQMNVSSFHPVGRDLFYLCPRCDAAIEREYMSYCCSCGQRLGWQRYRKSELMMDG